MKGYFVFRQVMVKLFMKYTAWLSVNEVSSVSLSIQFYRLQEILRKLKGWELLESAEQ